MFKRVLGISGIVVAGIAIAVGINTWGASGDVVAPTSESSTVVKVETPGAYATKLGDCFVDVPSAQGSSNVAAISCTAAHHWQLVSRDTIALDSFDAAKAQDGANKICTKAVTAMLKHFRKRGIPNTRTRATQACRLHQLLGPPAGALWTVYWAVPPRITRTQFSNSWGKPSRFLRGVVSEQALSTIFS